MNVSFHRLVPTCAVGAALAISSPAAHADGVAVEVEGAVAVGGATGLLHVELDVPRLRLPSFALRAAAGWDFGVDFAEPPPPPCPGPCEDAVPSVYVSSPPPVVHEVYVADRSQAPPPPRFRRIGVGAFAGTVDVDDQEVGSDLGLLGRFRMTQRLSFEVELARSEISKTGRSDRRFGASLLYDFVPHRSFSPLILAGAGFGQTRFDERELRAGGAYGEVGGGLTYRINRRAHLVADARLGKRDTSDESVARMVGPGAPIQEEETYSRLRLGALFFF